MTFDYYDDRKRKNTSELSEFFIASVFDILYHLLIGLSILELLEFKNKNGKLHIS